MSLFKVSTLLISYFLVIEGELTHLFVHVSLNNSQLTNSFPYCHSIHTIKFDDTFLQI